MNHTKNTSITAQLLGLEPVKTWSLIATIFGDLEDGSVSGKQLKSLLEPLGIKPEAMRVALHRLKKDGWIVAQKSGREVTYQLSDAAQAETIAARGDVYRNSVKFAGGWQMILLAPETPPPEHPHVTIEKGCVLMPVGQSVPQSALVLNVQTELPLWFEKRLVPEHLLMQAAQLAQLAQQFHPTDLSQDEAARSRLMFVHLWRKMALRLGTWAHIGLLPDGAMAKCHQAMMRVFTQTQHTRA